MTPTLSLIIPTAGRASLRRTLESAAPQVLPGDECIVVGDVLDGPLPQTEAICRDFPWVRYIEHAGEAHTWGHEQMAAGIGQARGDWLFGNDDDDVWTPDAFAAIREAIAYAERPRPLLFRFKPYFTDDLLIWHTPGMEWVKQGHIGGHCLVQPGHAHGKVGAYGGARYEADYDWVVATLKNWEPIEPLWCDHVIAVQRPKEDR